MTWQVTTLLCVFWVTSVIAITTIIHKKLENDDLKTRFGKDAE